MSSMAMQAIEMGIDPCIGPDHQPWDGPGRCFYEDCDDNHIKKEPEWFATAQEAQSYAKENIGTVITRSPDGNGYIIKR